MVDVDNDVSLDRVYKYTERCVDGCSRSFNGLRNRIGLFLGSGSLLIRLAWDLDNSPLRLMTVILSTAVVIYSTFALKPENIGDSWLRLICWMMIFSTRGRSSIRAGLLMVGLSLWKVMRRRSPASSISYGYLSVFFPPPSPSMLSVSSLVKRLIASIIFCSLGGVLD